MNKTYRIIWSETHQAFVVANEKAATRGKPSSTRKAVAQAVVAALLALAAPAALAGTSCPGLGGAITVTGADDQTCDLVTGDSLTVNLGGAIAASSIGVAAHSGVTVGGITNHGTISATSSSAWAISVFNSTVGGIINSGTISSPSSDAIHIAGSAITGGIHNTGLITGWKGVAIENLSTITGGINNSDTITGGYGIYAVSSSTINGGITNSGTITAQRTGVYVDNASISGGITNSGTISGGGGTYAGIGLYNASTISGGITNSGTISGSAYAIYVDGTSTLDGIVIASNTPGVSTARFIGAVNAPATPMSIASGATYTLRGDDDFRVASFTNNGTARFDSAGGVTPNFNLGNVTGNTFANNSVLAVAAGTTGTITGDYTQAAGGTFRTHVTDDTTYGKLVVSGTATLPSNAKIDVNVADPNFSFTASSMANIISAGTLTSDGTFTVTDNSLLFNFGAVKDSNTVDLTITAAAPAAPGVLTSVTNTGNTPATGAATALDIIIAGDPTGPVGSLFVGFSTEQQVSNAVSQTLPLLTGGSQVAASAALTGINRVIQARQERNRGLSSGDLFYGDKKFWMKPFGSWADQDDRNGVSGYKARTGGLAFGADATISNETRVGLSFAYARVAVDGSSSVAPNSMDVDVYQLVGYGSHVLDADSEINFQVGIGQNKNDGRRDLLAFGTVAKADFTSQTATAGVGYGRTLKLGEQTGFTPSLRADYSWIRDKGYTETGAGAMNLNVESRTTDELILAADGKLTHEIATGRTVSANLGLGYDVLGEQVSIMAAYAGAPTVAFTTRGLDPNPWMVRGGAGAEQYHRQWRRDFCAL